MPIFALTDATEVRIRRIRADDGDRLRASHDRLSPDSRYRRFLAAKPHLSIADARYLVEIDGSNHFALVATIDDEEDSIVAVARFIRIPEAPDAAEFAIVVGDAFQDKGLGTELLTRLGQAATERGITHFRATALADNLAVHRLLQRVALGQLRERRMGSLSEIELELAADGEAHSGDAPALAGPAMIAGCAGS